MATYLRDKQLCEKLGNCSLMTLWRLRDAGKLPKPRKLNGRNYTNKDEANAAIEAIFDSESNSAA